MINIYLNNISSAIRYNVALSRRAAIFKKFSTFTMIRMLDYADNLELCESVANIQGDIVECGVWRGGMIAGIAQILGDNRKYFLFDSFEGLPPVTEKDGAEAKKWQEDKTGATYHENCKAEMSFAAKAMEQSGCKDYSLEKGWFNETLPVFTKSSQIAVLRLDGDWYDSTMCCLENLYPKVVSGGLIIIDDYYTWDGCTKAVHDYLSREELTVRIEKTKNGVCYIRKR